MHPLDAPIWNSLQAGWAELAQGDAHVVRLDPEHGPFAATASAAPAEMAALAGLIPQGGELWLLGRDALAPTPAGLSVQRTALLAQMVAYDPVPACDDGLDWRELDEADAADMHALALLTKPGPFRARTHRLGRFIGVREEGRLIAMAGERMRMPGYAEVSGVCTHPDFRGRGLAGRLMRQVMQTMQARGETPFLHAYASHEKTIALYRAVGFKLRAELPMSVLISDVDPPALI
ncbi:MAG: GNAT family N-acetyltransferase [Pseudomonadota bacterium]|uniref:GNAT family N-acetyltransferase n=1 Tax=Sphingobium naphthae TaxID=1886786 RepID=UPI002B141A7C|nr:GNAT family N-acetyltransferase [Pseudomonadota bacterium]